MGAAPLSNSWSDERWYLSAVIVVFVAPMDYPYPLVMTTGLCSVPQQSEIEYPFRARFLPSVLPEAVMDICN